jgi:hypothetical protein
VYGFAKPSSLLYAEWTCNHASSQQVEARCRSACKKTGPLSDPFTLQPHICGSHTCSAENGNVASSRLARWASTLSGAWGLSDCFRDGEALGQCRCCLGSVQQEGIERTEWTEAISALVSDDDPGRASSVRVRAQGEDQQAAGDLIQSKQPFARGL